jgi:hypothetical protein
MGGHADSRFADVGFCAQRVACFSRRPVLPAGRDAAARISGMIATAVRAAAMTPMIRMIGDGAECDWRQSRSTLFAQRQNP